MARASVRGDIDPVNGFTLLITELIGSCALVFVGCGAAISAALKQPIAGQPVGSAGVALAFGLVVTICVYAFGSISGCHLNPAITLSYMLNGKLATPLYGVFYFAGQLAGSIAAALLLRYAYGERAVSVAHLAATEPAKGVSLMTVFILEALATGFLVLIVHAMSSSDTEPAAAGLAIGGALAAGILVIGPLTGGGLNPTRTIATMLVSEQWTGWWVYLSAQFAGAIVFGLLFEHVLIYGYTPEPVD